MINKKQTVQTSPTYEEIFQTFESDLARTKDNKDQGTISEARASWSLEVLAVRTPPGQLIKRLYTIDTQDYTLTLEESCVGAESKRETYKLCLLRSELIEHVAG